MVGNGRIVLPVRHRYLLVSLGNLNINHIRHRADGEVHQAPGGPGFNAILGARIVMSPEWRWRSQKLVLLISAQNDLGNWLQQIEADWKTTIFQTNNHGEHPTHEVEANQTDPLNPTYTDRTPAAYPSPERLPGWFTLAKFMHIVGTPQSFRNQSSAIDFRKQIEQRVSRRRMSGPFYVWEPQSSHCLPENLDAHLSACADATIFSPTSTDLERLLSLKWAHQPSNDVQTNTLRFANLLHPVNDVNELKFIVVRCGMRGVCVFDTHNGCRWFHFREPANPRPNTVGYGHAFLGAFIMKLAERSSYHQMINSALTAADIVLNHWGMPLYKRPGLVSDEKWNGRTAKECAPGQRGGWLRPGEVESTRRRLWRNFRDSVSDWFE